MSHTLLLWPLHVRSCIFTLTLPSKTSNGCFFPLFPFNQFYAIVLLLFANVIRLRQGYGSLSAPVDRSELLISSSIHVTFAKAERPKQAPLERSTLQDSEKASAGLKKKTQQFSQNNLIYFTAVAAGSATLVLVTTTRDGATWRGAAQV